jgi:hypothetical protein
MSVAGGILGNMGRDADVAWVPGTNPTPPASMYGARDVALGLRLIAESAQAADPDHTLAQSIAAGRLLGHGVVSAISALQRAGKLPPCGTPAWARLVDQGERGQVSIAPVLLIGADEYACASIVEERIRGNALPPPRPAAVPSTEPLSLQDELGKMGLI